MDVVGKIIAALPPKSGTSQSTGKPWQVNTYVLQTTSIHRRTSPSTCSVQSVSSSTISKWAIWSQCQSTSTLTNTTDAGTTKSEPGTL